MAKQFKTDIKYSITLDDEQKNVKKSIFRSEEHTSELQSQR